MFESGELLLQGGGQTRLLQLDAQER